MNPSEVNLLFNILGKLIFLLALYCTLAVFYIDIKTPGALAVGLKSLAHPPELNLWIELLESPSECSDKLIIRFYQHNLSFFSLYLTL